jgi:hypothetical protein
MSERASAPLVVTKLDSTCTHPNVVDRSYLETGRIRPQDFLLEILDIVEAVVPDIGRFP